MTFYHNNYKMRYQLYTHALNQTEQMTINDVKKFYIKKRGRVITATLLIEYMRVTKIYNLKQSLDPQNKLPADVLKIIFVDYLKNF